VILFGPADRCFDFTFRYQPIDLLREIGRYRLTRLGRWMVGIILAAPSDRLHGRRAAVDRFAFFSTLFSGWHFPGFLSFGNIWRKVNCMSSQK
jgi:hypothetical protein